MDTSRSNASNTSCLSFIPVKLEQIITEVAPDFQTIKLCWTCAQQGLSLHPPPMSFTTLVHISYYQEIYLVFSSTNATNHLSSHCSVLEDMAGNLWGPVRAKLGAGHLGSHQNLPKCSQINFSHFWLGFRE